MMGKKLITVGDDWLPIPVIVDDDGTVNVVHMPPMPESSLKFFLARLEDFRPWFKEKRPFKNRECITVAPAGAPDDASPAAGAERNG